MRFILINSTTRSHLVGSFYEIYINKFYYTVASRWFFLWDLHYDARIHRHQARMCEDSALLAFLYVRSCTQNASEQFVPRNPPFFCKLRSSFNPTNKKSNEGRSGDSNSSTRISVTIHNYTHVDMNFILTITNTVTSKILTFPRESPCIY